MTADPLPPLTPDRIRLLCDEWCKATMPSPGTILVGGQASEQFRLRNNGAVFHQLDHEQLSVALVSLSRVLLLPGLNTVIDLDHLGTWSWCAELLLGRFVMMKIPEQRVLHELYSAAIRAALARARAPVANKEEWQAQQQIEMTIPRNAREFLKHDSAALAYISFPLLEAVVKSACQRFVGLNGIVSTEFFIPQKPSASTPNPGPKRYPVGKKISSLRDLLVLHRDQVADQQLNGLLHEFGRHLQTLDPSITEPFDLIYEWRNDSLHGNASLQTVGGTLLNLSLLISIQALRADFATLASSALQNVRYQLQSADSPWRFYPPI